MVNGLHAENVYKFYFGFSVCRTWNIWSSGGCIAYLNAANSVEIFISFIYYYFAFDGILLFLLCINVKMGISLGVDKRLTSNS